MIIDNKRNTKLYYGLGKLIEEAFTWFHKNGQTANLGEHKIHGNDVFAIVSNYNTKHRKQGLWEAHKKYIDIHFIINGAEKIGYANINQLKIVNRYDKGKDITFLTGDGIFFTLNKNHFMIFHPWDAHMPGIILKNSKNVKKVVIKVKI